MKTAIRKYLLARKLRRLAQNLQHLVYEAEMNRVYQGTVTREMQKIQVQLMDLEITARREMMV